MTDRCGGAPMALSNTSVTSETVSICSREPRWRTTACASAMKSQTSLAVAYDMIYAPTDPRLTSIFHDVRLERTYVHHADGFDLLASETPRRLTIPLDQWLPARYLVSFTWPVPAQRIERRDDGIPYYNKSRAVDMPFIATVSTDKAWVIASFARTAGNVWSNPELTCQHVDPQTSLSPGQRATIELKLLVIRGSLDDALERAIRQREPADAAPTGTARHHRAEDAGHARLAGGCAAAGVATT